MKGEGPRYLVAVVIGLAIDLGVAMALREAFRLPNLAAAAVGFTCGLCVNYVNFEKWVFARNPLTFRGLARLFAAAQTALLLRLGAVWLLTLAGLVPAAVFALAAALSFAANFFLSRLAIQRKVRP